MTVLLLWLVVELGGDHVAVLGVGGNSVFVTG